MAVLAYNEITNKKIIELDGELYEVLEFLVFRMQKRKPVNQTKLRNIITGKTLERSFHATEKVEEADIDTRKVKFLYHSKGEFWFCEENDPSKRFKVEEQLVGDAGKYMKANTVVDMMTFEEDRIVGFRLPVKVTLKVVSAPPAVKGNTSGNAMKQVELENGITVNTPLFINEGDYIVINTTTGEYSERAEKQ
jgi:elongation factor P